MLPISTANILDSPLILGRSTILSINEVLFFEGDINYTWVHFAAQQHKKVLAKTLLEIEEKIASQHFVRVSRKHLVNRKYIIAIGKDYIELIDGSILTISRRRRRLLL